MVSIKNALEKLAAFYSSLAEQAKKYPYLQAYFLGYADGLRRATKDE